MTKILVKKSAPKGVLVKQVQPQLMQTPDRGKGFMDFFRTTFAPKDTQGVGVKQRLAGLAGMAGKVGAGLSTVNDTMQAMQGGNISAPLGMGYTFEAKDPTGRMISEAANPNAPPRQSIEEQRGNVNQVALPAPVAPIPALPPPTPAAQPPTPQGYQYTVDDFAANQTGVSPAFYQQQTVTGSNPPPLPSTHAPAPFPMVDMTNPPQPRIDPATGQPYPTLMPQDSNQQKNASFVTALTEKLGADIVYKMSPHEIGTFSAYTLLKLR